MKSNRESIKSLFQAIEPFDAVEAEHKKDVIKWIDSGVPLFRVSKPDNPPKHLVSYFVLYDSSNDSIMLIDHVKAKLWLPPGGHVDINEHPRDTVVREAKEELDIDVTFDTNFGDSPLFVTVTETKHAGSHTDVSLWHIVRGDSSISLNCDSTEINSYKWQTLDQVLETDISKLDPHMHSFVNKMKQYLA